MISKILFALLALLFSFFIAKNMKLGKIAAWFFLLIGIINGIASLVMLVQKENFIYTFNYFLGFEVFSVIGGIHLSLIPNFLDRK